jgi:hypothetical protein
MRILSRSLYSRRIVFITSYVASLSYAKVSMICLQEECGLLISTLAAVYGMDQYNLYFYLCADIFLSILFGLARPAVRRCSLGDWACGLAW